MAGRYINPAIIGGIMKIGSKSSLWLVIAGIIFLISGLVVLAYPGVTLEAMAIILGLGILASGVLELFSYIGNSDPGDHGWVLLCGILDVLIGLFLLFNIIPTTVALPFLVGFWAIFTSIARIAASVTAKKRHYANWWILMLTGIIGLILAILIIYYPVFGALFIAAYISIYLMFLGFMLIWEALFIRKITA